MALDDNKRRYLEHLAGETFFMLGDEACAYGALFAGCDFFAGYPITPASEVAELMAKELPKSGGIYIQMEDELASMAAIVGASWTGSRTMTATSGPGFSLMQENLGYAIMTETPCVIVDVQRSGPSTGQATKPAQGDVMQARWGTHGDHNIIALAPNSGQECFDLMLDCFDLSDTYRTPVIMLMDGEIGHFRESVSMPPVAAIKHVTRKRAKSAADVFGGDELVPGMIHYGEGHNIHVTGSTHLSTGMRDVSTDHVHNKLVRRICRKIEANREQIVKVAEDITAGGKARVGVISYGATSRPALGAVKEVRDQGKDVDFLRLITIWPFARKQVTEFARDLDVILVPEMNLGQMSREIERFVGCEVVSLSKIGGVPHSVTEITQAILERIE
ncbi:MAG: 2-oxoacid:acceptor oxidoreductase subunit alpha [candidate division Zixibacteria bacterium]|nr:2-oxoacid:acceptor oxidoreductase subunit alpha [candidate division Zixibacteria bacterium]